MNAALKNPNTPTEDDWPSEYVSDSPNLIAVKPRASAPTASSGNPHGLSRSSSLGQTERDRSLLSGSASLKRACPSVSVSRLDGPTSSPIPNHNKLNHYPGLFHRSGLFSVGRAGDGHRTEEVKSQGRYGLAVDGPSLSMHDKAVWEAVIDIAKERGHDLSKPLRTSLSEIARKCGAEFTGSRTTAAVREGLGRLSRTNLECSLDQAGRVKGRILAGVEIGSHGASVSFDPELMAALLGADFNFHIDIQRRGLLSGSLARWMHDFLSTHSQSRPMTLKYVRELCGYTSDPKRFPAALADAMEELMSKAPGLVSAFDIDRKTRTSDFWTLQIVRGPELPKFVGFNPKAQSQATKPGGRRGGVVL